MEENEEILIFSGINENEVNQVCAVLADNEIPFIRRDDGSGSYMTIYMGFSIQEKRIFVLKKDYEKAEKLVSAMFSNNIDNTEDIPELEEVPLSEEEKEDYYDRQNFLKRLMRFWYVDIGVIVIILLIIMAILG